MFSVHLLLGPAGLKQDCMVCCETPSFDADVVGVVCCGLIGGGPNGGGRGGPNEDVLADIIGALATGVTVTLSCIITKKLTNSLTKPCIKNLKSVTQNLLNPLLQFDPHGAERNLFV